MADQRRPGAPLIGLVAVAAVLIVGLLGAGAWAMLAADGPTVSGTAAAPSTRSPTTIVYLTVPRTAVEDTVAPAGSAAPVTVLAPAVTSGPATGASAPAGPPRFVFPVDSNSTHYDSGHHDYPAADMFAPCGTAALAATDGTIEEIHTTDDWNSSTDDPAQRSGLLVSLVDARGVRYYGSHLESVSVQQGQRVGAGDQIGTVGETGNAAGTGCHLHFGLSPACRTGWQNRRGLLAPQPFLNDWRRGVATDPLAAVEALGCG